MIDLKEICGEKIYERIRERFGDDLERIIEDLELEKLMEIDGIGKKTALKILKAVYEEKTGIEFQDILSGDSERIYSGIIDILQEYPVTKEAKNKFLLFYPTNNRDFIEKRLKLCDESIELLSRIENLEEVLKKMKKMKKLEYQKEKKYREYVIITDDEKVYDSLDKKYCDVMLVSSTEEVKYFSENYMSVIYVYSDNSDLYEEIMGEADVVSHIRSFNIEEAIPEITLNKFLINRDTIESAHRIYSLLGIHSFLDDVIENLKKIDTEEKEIDIDRIILEVERKINKEIEERIEKEDLSIDGRNILSIMEEIKRSESPIDVIKRRMPSKINEIYNDILKKYNEDVYRETEISILDLFPPEITFPVEADYEKVEEMKTYIKKSRFKKRYRKMKEIANIGRYWKEIERITAEIFEIDLKIAIARFIKDYNLEKPVFIEGGISFHNGRNLFLKEPVGITYKIGETPETFVGNERVVVLTGANSGGKTTLLETILQIQILSQIGLYVPAERTYTTIFSEIQYLAKQKSMGAGALETTLKNLIKLSTEKKKRLILIDELEAVTEPGSAAKIIGEFLNILNENEECFVIIVTHLGEEILKIADVRCDGIEASGLDENLNLIVDRQPVFYKIGKSTPEIIVEKLYKKSENTERELFGRILKRLKE